MTRLLLIRHAHVDTHARLCGSLDLRLSPGGMAQVESLVRRRPARPGPDVLYTSTLARARQVAGALAAVWSLQPRAAEWAREIDCGSFEGMPLDELRRRHPELWRRNEAQDDEAFAWPGGETYAQFRGRILCGLARVAAAHESSRIAVVTHAGVVSQVLGAIRRRPASMWAIDRPRPLTATEVLWAGGAPREVVSYDDPDWY